MDFGLLPPEVISAQIYSGPGSAPLLAAARAWSTLAVELEMATCDFKAAIAALITDGWAGPAAEAMAARVRSHSRWLACTAALAQQTANRCNAAAVAFGEVFAAVVSPVAVADNRAELASLVETNVLGQNGGAIAAVESDYTRMWAQNQSAMARYASRSQAAATLTPFPTPPAGGNPDAGGAQLTAATNLAAVSSPCWLSRLVGGLPQTLTQLGVAPGPSGGPSTGSIEPLQGSALPSLSNLVAPVESLARSILPANDANISVLYGQGQFARNLNFDLDMAKAPTAPAAPASQAPSDAAGRAVSGRLANAARVGDLAVPARWPQIAPAALIGADSSFQAAPVASGAAGAIAAAAAMAALAGRMSGTTAVSSPPAIEKNRLRRIAEKLTGTTQVHQWHPGAEPTRRLFGELAEKPGVHTVYLDPDRDIGAARSRLPGRR